MADASSAETAPAVGNLRRVVVSVDGSEESMNALRWAINNLRFDSPGEGGKDEVPGVLHILHVQSPPSIAAGLSPGVSRHVEVPAFTAAIEAHQRRISEAIIAHAREICAEKHELICEVTANLHADLLVMGCRAFGPIKRMFLGSVSNYCVNHVQCPVVVIKGTQKA
ncbi:unnamed protein product [Spirodela intermedia]|uniref:UspA domain-containing protein n=1 Tax=Spirodela intermedia TaxID=51605 RepID=A0A7I8IPS9_SPIIN|nr:unnamed protein product [Spirodela intermedia]CAA6659493.1 unnamed protein product [Spirodela intermedia]